MSAAIDTLTAELTAALREERESFTACRIAQTSAQQAFARLLAARDRLALARAQLDEVLSPTTPEAS